MGTIRGERDMARPAVLLVAIAAAGALAACATPVGIKRVSPEAVHQQFTANVLITGEASDASRQVLRRLNLTAAFDRTPRAVLAEIHGRLGGPDEVDLLFALAELSLAYGSASDDRRYVLAAAVYAYCLAFPEEGASRLTRYDPRLRLAIDLYNRSIAEGLSTRDGSEVDLRGRRAPQPVGELRLATDRSGFSYGGYALSEFVALTDVEVRGLRNRYRRPGVGATLAAKPVKPPGAVVDPWLPARARVPVTAFVRFHTPCRGISTGRIRGTIELYDPSVVPAVWIDGRSVPLEFDYSAILGYRLEGAPIWDFEIAGFRRGDLRFIGLGSVSGMFMVQPYVPGRIPLVLVHGTASSPARWAQLLNEIMGDPGLAGRYQVWGYTYNTGNPVLYSALGLREGLAQLIAHLDPEGRDPALRRIVVIGHSQGGLLTKTTVVDSGDAFWRNLSDVPFEEADLPPKTRDLLRRGIFLRPVPSVERVVFIATPHRGSFLTENVLGRLARRLVSLPGDLTRMGLDLARLSPERFSAMGSRLPTSIDNMDWSNPGLRTLASLPIVPGVHAHSIIAVKGDGPPEEGNDGVVAYTSAH